MRVRNGEVILPERKPAMEWILGRAHQKVSPKWTHALLQGRLTALIAAWAGDRGRVGPEWRFRLQPPGDIRRPLVPDVAFISFERLPRDAYEEAEEPAVAPELAVEIVSPAEHRVLREEKVRVYLASGVNLVVVVQPQRREVELHDASGVRIARSGERITSHALPDFMLTVDEVFADPLLPPPQPRRA